MLDLFGILEVTGTIINPVPPISTGGGKVQILTHDVSRILTTVDRVDIGAKLTKNFID